MQNENIEKNEEKRPGILIDIESLENVDYSAEAETQQQEEKQINTIPISEEAISNIPNVEELFMGEPLISETIELDNRTDEEIEVLPANHFYMVVANYGRKKIANAGIYSSEEKANEAIQRYAQKLVDTPDNPNNYSITLVADGGQQLDIDLL